LRQAQLQFPPRHRAGRGRLPRSLRHGGAPVGSRQVGSRVHRLRQGHSPQNQHGVVGHRRRAPSGRRAVQDGGRYRHGPRALSRWRAGGHRSHRRAGAGLLRHHCLVDRVCQDWQAGALAGTTAARSEALPDIPTVAEFVPGYEASGWFGLGAPKGTPVEIIDMLNKEINAALADPKMKARLADLGGTVLAGSPADFGKLIAEETEKWAKVIRAANIRPE